MKCLKVAIHTNVSCITKFTPFPNVTQILHPLAKLVQRSPPNPLTFPYSFPTAHPSTTRLDSIHQAQALSIYSTQHCRSPQRNLPPKWYFRAGNLRTYADISKVHKCKRAPRPTEDAIEAITPPPKADGAVVRRGILRMLLGDGRLRVLTIYLTGLCRSCQEERSPPRPGCVRVVTYMGRIEEGCFFRWGVKCGMRW